MAKLIGWGHEMNPPAGLVLTPAPIPPAVARHHRALVASKNHPLRLIRINPQLMIIIATRRSLDHRKGLPAIARTVQPCVRHIHRVRVFRVHAYFAKIPAAPPDPLVFRNTPPILASVVLPVQSASLCICNQINPPWITRRKRNPQPPQPFARQSMPAQLLPMLPAVFRTIQSCPRPFRRRVNIPRRPPRLPQRSKNRLWISPFKFKVDTARLFVIEQHPVPLLPAILPIKKA